ncbi:hypothetical protein BH09VER1_BH09VER1_46640 [soil metagenome]
MPSNFWNCLKAGQTQTVVLYGTSLTAGGAWTGELTAWFHQKFPGQLTIINSAGPGENSTWGLAQLADKVLVHHPDLILLEFSYNDAHEKFHLSVEQAYANLAAMVQAIQQQDPSTLIALQIMNVGWDAPNGNRSASVRPHLTAYADNYRRHAREKNLPLLDHSLAWSHFKEHSRARFQTLIPDGSHPTPEGSRQVTWPTLLKWLQFES